MVKIEAVDLFCGAGGLTYGLERAGIDVRLGVDIDPACEYPYTVNNGAKFLLRPVEELDGKSIAREYTSDSIRLLAGCAPCQTFSTYNRKADPSDARWGLVLQFARLIEENEPDLVTMENVPGLVKTEVFERFLNSLHVKGYRTFFEIVDCSEYGLPQRRKRLVLLASRFGEPRLMSAEEFGAGPTTVAEAIGCLPRLDAGSADETDPLHVCSALSALNLRRIRASKPGGTWRDWPQELLPACYRRESGKTYPSVYGRMKWDEPAPTITTQFYGYGNGRFGHPEQDRALSLREGAILQGFPRGYRFVPEGESVSIKTVGRLIGNAVPPLLGEVIGRSLMEHVRCVATDKEYV